MSTTTAPLTWHTGPLAALWGDAARPHGLREILRPGLPLPPAEDRPFWSSLDPATLRVVSEDAVAEASLPWPQPLASDYARYFREGTRTASEDKVRARQHRLTRAATVAAATLDPDWIDRVADGVQLLCEQSTWCWVAHDDTRSRFGHVVPTIGAPYLDLGAGEVVAQLAVIDHVLGAALDDSMPGLRARIRTEAFTRVFEPFLTRRDWHWLGLDGSVHNWNPWIHGNVLTAALQLIDDPALRAEIVGRVVDGLDRYLSVLPADGAIDEGFAYWWNGAGRALEALDLLAHATGDRLDAGRLPLIRELIRYPHRMHLGGDRYYNVADGPARITTHQPWHLVHGWAGRLGDDDARAHAAAQRDRTGPVSPVESGIGRLFRALGAREWVDAEPSEPPLVRSVWLPSVQLMVSRPLAGRSTGLTVASKGGHNGEHHNHKDLGSYVVALDGVPVLVDIGKPTYTAQTFGPDRYSIRTMQSGWHNAPAPFGLEQGAGREYAASATVDPGIPETDAVEYDLTRAYPASQLTSWRRRIERREGEVVVTDAWEAQVTGDEAGMDIHHVISGDVERLADDRFVVRSGGGSIVIEASGADLPPVLERWELDDPELRGVWGESLHRLTIRSRPRASGSISIRIREEG